MSARTERSETSGVRELTGFRVRLPAAPGPVALRAIYDELRALDGVRACMLGYKRRGERWTSTLALVCGVEAKRPERTLRRADRVPTEVRWGTGGHAAALPTDVVELGESRMLVGPALGPGDAVLETLGPEGQRLGGFGTVGFPMAHPDFGVVVTTAAHVVGQTYGTTIYPDGKGPRVLLANGGGADDARFAGVVRKASLTERADYAIITPVGPAAGAVRGAYEDLYPLGAPYYAAIDDVKANPRLFVLTARGARPTKLRYVEAVAPVGALDMQRVLITGGTPKGDTVDGDSGAALVDGNLRLWGVLNGRFDLGPSTKRRRYSVFTPAHVLLTAEKAEPY